ncbi:hypothetical protein M5K25_000499 [Dendrobium thyrsiflorum]|uniref:Reverse transcriptase zinc-binding domain-containing protein n=1 Tax=Dendrobium thyrsiflorum TaxID=117978 RepID=A0ABD0W732_DENTH
MARFCAKFLYFCDTTARKLHLISWKNTCKPKVFGGLGIPSLYSVQFSFTCSLIVRLYNCHSLLSKWLLHKYVSPWKPPSTKSSPFWKYLCKVACVGKNNFNFFISNNTPISLFWDHWINGKALHEILDSSLYPNLLHNLFPINAKISVILSDNGWVLPPGISSSLMHTIYGIPVLPDNNGCLLWGNVMVNKFSSYYNFIYRDDYLVNWHHYIWHKHFALRYSSFCWMAVLGGLKTADVLRARGISVDSSCSFCHSSDESINHIFFECDFSFSVISNIIPVMKNQFLRPTILQAFAFTSAGPIKLKHLHHLIICCSVYHLWRERNDRKFGSSYASSTTICHMIKSAVLSKILRWKDGSTLLELL